MPVTRIVKKTTDGMDRASYRQGSSRRLGDHKEEMAAPVGATVGCYSRSPESSGIFPADAFGFGRSTSDRCGQGYAPVGWAWPVVAPGFGN